MVLESIRKRLWSLSLFQLCTSSKWNTCSRCFSVPFLQMRNSWLHMGINRRSFTAKAGGRLCRGVSCYIFRSKAECILYWWVLWKLVEGLVKDARGVINLRYLTSSSMIISISVSEAGNLLRTAAFSHLDKLWNNELPYNMWHADKNSVTQVLFDESNVSVLASNQLFLTELWSKSPQVVNHL